MAFVYNGQLRYQLTITYFIWKHIHVCKWGSSCIYFTFSWAEPVGLALDLVDWPCPSVLTLLLGSSDCKIVSKMTYNVSDGSLNPTMLSLELPVLRHDAGSIRLYCNANISLYKMYKMSFPKTSDAVWIQKKKINKYQKMAVMKFCVRIFDSISV